MDYLIDTNILIYYFNGITLSDKVNEILISSFNISIITQIEFLGWNKFTEDDNLNKQAELLIQNAKIYELSRNIAIKTIEIRKIHKIKTPDAIIAATAITENYTLVTGNENDFKQLQVNILNPLI